MGESPRQLPILTTSTIVVRVDEVAKPGRSTQWLAKPLSDDQQPWSTGSIEPSGETDIARAVVKELLFLNAKIARQEKVVSK